MDSDKFTDKEIHRICMWMHIIDTYDKYPLQTELPHIKKESDKIRSLINRFIRDLTEEQKNILSDYYKKLCAELDSE
jgi:hypothetical protein